MTTKALFLCVDRAMFPPALLTAHTAREKACAHTFDIVIAVPENSIEIQWLDWAQSEVGVIVKEVPLPERLGIARTANRRIPPSTCYRYLFDLFVPPQYHKLVYLDADIRVTGDISRLFALDLGSHPFAACPDGGITAHRANSWAARYVEGLGWDMSIPYANAGVLVIDPKRWLELDIGGRVIHQVRSNLDTYVLIDQCALNVLTRGEFTPISPVWNMQMPIWLATDLSDVVAPAVLHYAGPSKPWVAIDWWGSPDENDAYQRFFRQSPCPSFASIGGRRPTWRQARRYLKRWAKWKLTGRRSPGNPQIDVNSYKRHIRTFPFEDKAQGLTSCDTGGVLRVAEPSAP